MLTSILTAIMMFVLSISDEVETPAGMESLLRTDSTSVVQFVSDGNDTLAVVAGSYEGVPFLSIYTEEGWKALRDPTEVTLVESTPAMYRGRSVTVLGLSSEL